jgi:hypothetical protein
MSAHLNENSGPEISRESDWAAHLREESGCSLTVLLLAASDRIGCTKLRRSAVLSLPTGSILKTRRRIELTNRLNKRTEVIPCFLGEIPPDVEHRKILWEVAKIMKAEGLDCFVYPPGRYPNNDDDLAHLNEALTSKGPNTFSTA